MRLRAGGNEIDWLLVSMSFGEPAMLRSLGVWLMEMVSGWAYKLTTSDSLNLFAKSPVWAS